MKFPTYNGPKLTLNYTDADDLRVLHRLESSIGYAIIVIGNPDNATYEWIVECGGKITHSDCGYGDSDIALRDGLIEMHGLPQSACPTRSLKPA